MPEGEPSPIDRLGDGVSILVAEAECVQKRRRGRIRVALVVGQDRRPAALCFDTCLKARGASARSRFRREPRTCHGMPAAMTRTGSAHGVCRTLFFRRSQLEAEIVACADIDARDHGAVGIAEVQSVDQRSKSLSEQGIDEASQRF